jgi:hypothetical protein
VRPQLPRPLESMTLVTSASGLGDVVVLGDLPRAGSTFGKSVSVFSLSAHFETVMSYNPFYSARLTPFCAVADVLYHSFNLGNGHLIQRLRRAYGCQSALDWDPLSASKRDPFERRVRPVALAPSELAGVAETVRARGV